MAIFHPIDQGVLRQLETADRNAQQMARVSGHSFVQARNQARTVERKRIGRISLYADLGRPLKEPQTSLEGPDGRDAYRC